MISTPLPRIVSLSLCFHHFIMYSFILIVIPLDKQARMRSTTLQKGAQVTARQQHVQGSGIKRHPRMPQMRRLTQEELLAEAKITEQKNTASLAQFLKLEEEKKNVKVTKVGFCFHSLISELYLYDWS